MRGPNQEAARAPDTAPREAIGGLLSLYPHEHARGIQGQCSAMAMAPGRRPLRRMLRDPIRQSPGLKRGSSRRMVARLLDSDLRTRKGSRTRLGAKASEHHRDFADPKRETGLNSDTRSFEVTLAVVTGSAAC